MKNELECRNNSILIEKIVNIYYFDTSKWKFSHLAIEKRHFVKKIVQILKQK